MFWRSDYNFCVFMCRTIVVCYGRFHTYVLLTILTIVVVSDSLNRVGVTKANFLHSVIISTFQNYQNMSYPLNFTFDRCHCSLAAVTPVKYECDLVGLISAFTQPETPLNKNEQRELIATPTPGYCYAWCCYKQLKWPVIHQIWCLALLGLLFNKMD